MGRKNKKGATGVRRNDRNTYRTYPEIKKEHEKLQRYYDTLLELPDDERQEFWEAYRRELPNSFRFAGSKSHALAVRKLLQTRYIPEITKITHVDGQSVDVPKEVPWYPNSLAWSMTTPKNVVRKFPPFKSFQRFLVSETSVGNISRQEVVSMIPPLLLDVRPGMAVLDMCAAPGSKAAQILEMVHVGEEARLRNVLNKMNDARADENEGGGDQVATTDLDGEAAELAADPGDDGRATGILVANDSDYKRSHMLIHQLKRLSSANMIVTNHDATLFPSLRIPNPEKPDVPKFLKFDRILADVPCSGDGTLRKNVNLWRDWQPGSALGLHLTQVRILVRALQLLKPGGRVVYSTCSMNPVENEAVVAAAIERCGGVEKIEIVDCAGQLPRLKRCPGLKKWEVMDKSSRIWGSWADVDGYTRTEGEGICPGRLVQTMFPPLEREPGGDLPLDRCMRVYAHHQDTGGFFITVLHKKVEFKAKPEVVNPNNNNNNSNTKRSREDGVEDTAEARKRRRPSEEREDDAGRENGERNGEASVVTEATEPGEGDVDANIGSTPTPDDTTNGEAGAGEPEIERKRKPTGPYEEPFKFLSPDHKVIKTVTQFYDISRRFPSDRYMVRNALGEPSKAIYYTSALVRDLLVLNEGKGVKFIHGGVKMFVKQDAPSAEVCRWRIQCEGVPILHAYVGAARILTLRQKDTLHRLLIEMFPKISDDLWRRLGEIGERVRDMSLGCSILRIEPDGDDPEFTERMAVPLWKSFQSLNLMLPKEDRAAMLLRVFNDTTPLINIGLARDQQQQQQKNGGLETKGEEAVEDGQGQGKEEEEEDDERAEQEMKGETNCPTMSEPHHNSTTIQDENTGTEGAGVEVEG